MVKVTGLLVKAESGLVFSFGVRAWTEMEMRCVEGMYRLKLGSSGKNSGFNSLTTINSPPGIDQGLSTASCNSRHALSARGVHPPTCPCPTSKQIAPTDNVRPKPDDTKRHHRLLKGLIYIQIYLAKISHYTMQVFNAYSLVLYFHICMAINCSNGL